MNQPMTVKEVAEYLRMNRMTIYRLASKGELPGAKVGRHWRFQRDLIDEWLRQKSTVRKARILVVDDEPVIGDLFKDVLGQNGHQVVATLSGHEALTWLRKQSFDLIFLDLKMPGVDGVETFSRIRQLDPSVPVVIITAYPDSDLMARALEQGPFGVMRKPFTASDIVEATRSFLGNALGRARETSPGGQAKRL